MTSTENGITARLTAFVESAAFRNSIMAVILINALALGLVTLPFDPPWFTDILPLIDQIVIAIFLIELALKLIAYRLRFFTSGWNWFDLIVILVSVVPMAGSFSVLRSLRILRAFRLFSVMPQMRKVVEALLNAIPGMGAVIAVLALMFYVSSVMATKLFAVTNPDRFGTLGDSAFSLFQVMTLEGWAADLALPVMEFHPWAWAFFLVFIVLTSFAILNLFIAIIVDSLQSKHFDADEQRDVEVGEDVVELQSEIAGLRGEIAALTALVQRSLEAPPPDDASASRSSKAPDSSE
ncbi:ion transporter [uncultured Maricaulis sp.]|uniref:ion transporter n=1 Tax=uncultured Maricaulis sp. TaxID=174710 RepID=UPI0030DA35B6|tara:strand:+ start:119979 stop:120860 length:882 start_codon:yes stop_codon:yes gene_type:complete